MQESCLSLVLRITSGLDARELALEVLQLMRGLLSLFESIFVLLFESIPLGFNGSEFTLVVLGLDIGETQSRGKYLASASA